MPPELVQEAAARLCWISSLFAATLILMTIMQWALQPEVALMYERPWVRVAALSTLLLTVGFAASYRYGWLAKCSIIKLGLVFEVLVAFYVALVETSYRYDGESIVRGTSMVALWIVLTGLLIPNTPFLKLISSVLQALMWPAAYFLNQHLNQNPLLPWNRFVIWLLPILVAVVWTALLSRRMYTMQMAKHKADELGSYKLDYMIGRGGMGEVWRARHRMLQRDAAVKIIRPEVLTNQGGRQASTMRRRFEKEAKATGGLRSPHTVALYDFGISRDSSFFYVMELLDGIDLQTLVERFGPQPAGRVAKLLVEACDSLEEAHRQGLVHRDVKPTNIFLCRLGLNYDFTKVLDFGLVKNLFADTTQSIMTMDGQATGTPAYMAPEVAMGSSTVDQRADLYGLGCVAYYLLTGQLVFNEPTPTALALAHVQKPPVPPSQRGELAVPASLERVVLQCLEKDPEKRPRSAQEVARMVEEAEDIPNWTRDHAHRWWQTNLPETNLPPAAPTLESQGSLDSRLTGVTVR
jgi:serine/threonine-protein kinase